MTALPAQVHSEGSVHMNASLLRIMASGDICLGFVRRVLPILYVIMMKTAGGSLKAKTWTD